MLAAVAVGKRKRNIFAVSKKWISVAISSELQSQCENCLIEKYYKRKKKFRRQNSCRITYIFWLICNWYKEKKFGRFIMNVENGATGMSSHIAAIGIISFYFSCNLYICISLSVCVTSWTKIIIVQRKMEYEEIFTVNNWIKRWYCWCVLFVSCPSFLILVVI